MSRYAIVTTAPDFLQRLTEAASGALEGEIHSWLGSAFPTGAQELVAQLPDPRLLDVLILGPGVPLDDALQLADEFEVQFPEVSVLLTTTPTPSVVLSAMRAGIRDVVEPDADVAGLSVLLHRATRSAAIRRRSASLSSGDTAGSANGRVIAVVSPKGGAGKTTVASNLAVGLAAAAPHATVLVDLDLQFGDVASALTIAPDHSVTDAVHGPARRDTMVLKSFLSAHPTGLFALCAPDLPDSVDQVTGEDVSHLLDQLASQYRYVVVDTSPGLSEHTLAALDKATDYVFVSGMDVPSVRGLRKELDVLRELALIPITRHIVLNNADQRDGLTVADVEKALNVKVDIVIPSSRAVRLSTNQGAPLMENKRRDPASKALRKLLLRFAPPVAVTKAKGHGRHRGGKK
ncbi:MULTISPECIES: AAA family ATPase [unclassified Arthrobacter]|uniref:AAA family ATPase n=1 Tax=unclassified Arthrobacter TaxID=235627 RepID=UPI001491CE27|nr:MULTISPECIES: AAA family ATPase [unclassified Arthrobacter]MBE0008811.1 MinD/ParA family protein [Arthrobacter sp. AET 35A]NOJ62709.1 AAA family ATPase [Arthrobacter sp. 147(2020)]